MNPLELRNMIALMYRGTTIIIPHPTIKIEVELTHDGLFIVNTSYPRNAGGIFSTSSLKEAVEIILPCFEVLPGQVYRHINGNVYKVLHIANEHSLRADYPPHVVYIGESNGRIWTKPLSNFINKMKRIK